MLERINGRIADILRTHRLNKQCTGLGADPDALRGPVQPPTTAISAAKQNAHAGYEAVVPNTSRAVQ